LEVESNGNKTKRGDYFTIRERAQSPPSVTAAPRIKKASARAFERADAFPQGTEDGINEEIIFQRNRRCGLPAPKRSVGLGWGPKSGRRPLAESCHPSLSRGDYFTTTNCPQWEGLAYGPPARATALKRRTFLEGVIGVSAATVLRGNASANRRRVDIHHHLFPPSYVGLDPTLVSPSAK
jgi:hypothetical protein